MAITQDTKVTIGTAGGLLVAVVGGALYLKGELSSLRNDLTTIQKDQYTMSMAVEQAFRMAVANPGMKVPDPRSPGNIIEVQRARITSDIQ